MAQNERERTSSGRRSGGRVNSVKKQIRKRRSDFYFLIAVGMLAVFLLSAVVNLVVKDKDTSSYTGDALTQKPAFTSGELLNGTYTTERESYFADQLAGRNTLLSIRQKFLHTMGVKAENNVFICDDDYLLTSPYPADSSAPNATISALNSFGADHTELKQYLMVIPSSANIYSDRLPSGADVYDQQTEIAGYTDQLTSVTNLDVASVLTEHNTEGIYYKTDPHWTSLGAYYTFMAFADQLGAAADDSYQTYTVADDWRGALVSLSGDYSAKDSIEVYQNITNQVEYTVTRDGVTGTSVYSVAALDSDYPYDVFMGGTSTQVEIDTQSGSSEVLLIVGDDYANTFVQFLTPFYKTILMVDPNTYTGNIDELMLTYDVTTVLYLYGADNFLSDTGLTNMINSAIPLEKRGGKIYTEEQAAAIDAGKVIYLTFDDGPGPYTEELLDILDKYPEVKVTFFTTDQYDDYVYLLTREAESGHTVAVHSYWHDYQTIYSSTEGFWEDMDKMNDLVESLTGTRATIFRFPGGASNTVSRKYCEGIMTELAAEMEEKGYHFFDWNVTSGDAGDTTDTNEIIANIENGIEELSGPAIVLQHDIKDFSVAAVETVIQWGLDNGYVFMPITDETTEYHQNINN